MWEKKEIINFQKPPSWPLMELLWNGWAAPLQASLLVVTPAQKHRGRLHCHQWGSAWVGSEPPAENWGSKEEWAWWCCSSGAVALVPASKWHAAAGDWLWGGTTGNDSMWREGWGAVVGCYVCVKHRNRQGGKGKCLFINAKIGGVG